MLPEPPPLPPVDEPALTGFLAELLLTPSPTGLTGDAVALMEKVLTPLPGVTLSRTRKGALLATLPGRLPGSQRAVTAHLDTLGAVVKEIKPSGRLRLSVIGGVTWNTVEGEGCTVLTAAGGRIRGSILVTAASAHVYGKKLTETPRTDENMEVRLDERTASAAETRTLGIEVGDFVTFDPRLEQTNGFVRSRHLDDKAGAACLVAAARALGAAGLQPLHTTHLFFSTFEEVGHGAAAGIPPAAEELLAVDMAAVGEGQNSDEFHATLCIKDSGGPYHAGLSQRLRSLAQAYDIPHRTDVYPFYGSDGGALWRAGGDVAVALIGPGVDASHNYERTHTQALLATTRWLLAYLLN